MNIPLNNPVKCKDGLCGRSAYMLVNRKGDHVTHVVVKEGYSFWERVLDTAEGLGRDRRRYHPAKSL